MEIYLYNYLIMPIYAKILNRRSFCIIASLQMFLILAFRSHDVGVDLTVYSQAFEYISSLSFFEMIMRIRIIHDAILPYPFSMEGGWMILNWTIAFLGLGFHSLLVVCAFINMSVCGLYIYKYSNEPWMSFCIICSLGVYTYMFGILRQSLALSIIVYAIDCYASKSEKKAWGWIFIAFTIHRTALLAIVLILIYRTVDASKAKYKAVLIRWIAFAIASPIIYQATKIFFRLFGKGYVGAGFRWNNLMTLLLFVCIATMMLFDFNKIKTRMQVFFLWCMWAAVFWETIGLYNDNLARSVQYFTYFSAFAIPLIVCSYKNKKVVFCGKGVVYTTLFLFLLYTLKGSAIVPYKMYLNWG